MYKESKNSSRPTIDEVHGFVNHVGASAHQEGREMKFTLCPFCNGGSHRDKNTFSINIDSGAFICHRASCGEKGAFIELAKKFNFPVTFEDERNSYNPPRHQTQHSHFIPQSHNSLVPENPSDNVSISWDEKTAIPLSEEIINYFARRGISYQTLRKYRVETGDTPQKIKWNFFEPTGKRIELVKFRSIDFNPETHKSKEICMANCRQILFGMEHCNPDYGPLVITEGQIDALSLSEAGIKNAVSVPIGKSGDKWFKNCYEFLLKFPEIIIFGDLEYDSEGIAHVTLLDHVENRINIPIRVIQIKDYLNLKDANEILVKLGKDALWNAYKNAYPLNVRTLTINNSCDIADVEDVDLENSPHFETGISDLDSRIGGFYPGQLILLTGKTGEGKSTFALQLLCNILHQDSKCLVYSGELNAVHVKNWLYSQLTGGNTDFFVCQKDNHGRNQYHVCTEIIKKINDWIRGKLYIYKNNPLDTNASESEKILTCCLEHIHKNGVKFILIDNLMTAVSSFPGDNVYDAQTVFVRELAAIAKRYGVVILLVAHSRKTKENLTLDDICGTSNISNFADVILVYKRIGSEYSMINCSVYILKSRLVSTSYNEPIKLHYFAVSKRIDGLTENNVLLPPKSFGWERTDLSCSNEYEPICTEYYDLPF